MDKQKPGEDAADRAPQERAAHDAPAPNEVKKRDHQDGANDDETSDDGRAISTDDLSSANDE